jgi:hypothetical protein
LEKNLAFPQAVRKFQSGVNAMVHSVEKLWLNGTSMAFSHLPPSNVAPTALGGQWLNAV